MFFCLVEVVCPPVLLESCWFQVESCHLVNAEHDVHVLHGLANGTFKKIVYGRRDEQLVSVFVAVYKSFICVDHLFHVNGLVHIVCEFGIFVEVLIALDDVFKRHVCLDHFRGENASGKVSTIGDEIYFSFQMSLHLFQTLLDFRNVLVLKSLVDAHVVVAPREVCCGTGLLPGT